MSNTILILGESGTGKSTSIRNLDPKETYILNVIDKPLPFKGARKKYYRTDEEKKGNYFSSDNHQVIKKLIGEINSNRAEIKNLIIDDWQYCMANEFMSRALERGYDKFSEIGKNAHETIQLLIKCREDLTCFVLTHSDRDEDGRFKVKTIGKMLNDKICDEGMFSIVLHSLIIDEKYKFLTQNDGIHIAKSPLGMFNDKFIDNDLLLVKNRINEYLNEDIEQ